MNLQIMAWEYCLVENKVSLGTWVRVTCVIFGGVGIFMWVMLSSVLGARVDQLRLEAPGSETIALREGLTYTVFTEYSRTVDSQSTHRPKGLAELKCLLTGVDSGVAVALETPSDVQMYGIRRVVGESLYEFVVPGSGTYRLTADFPLAEGGEPIVLVLRQAYAGQTMNAVFRGTCVLILTGGIVLVLLQRALAAGRAAASAASVVEG